MATDVGLAREDTWESVQALLGQFGRAAEEWANRFDFGISQAAIRGPMEAILSDARRTQQAGADTFPGGRVIRECLAALRVLAPNTYRKTMARIAGVFVIHAYFRSRMTDDDAARAIAASSLYELLQDLLDDLLDSGGWTFLEAMRLYEGCLRPLTDPVRSIDHLEEDLGELMAPGQEGLEHILAMATQELQHLSTAIGPKARQLIGEGHEALARAQASTVFLRREALDIASLAEIAATLPTPDPSLPWLDRLAICASWPSNIALFDAGLIADRVSGPELAAHARAWLFFNEAVSFLEHFAGAEGDARAGVLNVAGLHAKVPSTILDARPFPGFAPNEMLSLFEKATDCLVCAVRAGIGGGGRFEDYAFLALMIPTIIFAMCRTPSEHADAFMGTLAPRVRSAVFDARSRLEEDVSSGGTTM